VFASDASNLVAGDTNTTWDIFRRNWKGGGQTTTRISIATTGAQGNGPSRYPSSSNSGSRVAYYSLATNLLGAGVDTNGVQDCFLRDTAAGTTALISVRSSGQPSGGVSLWPAISSDGHYVAFPCADALAGVDTNNLLDVFLRGSL
jgi:hypothetical protein